MYRIQQILINYLSNAIKFMEKGAIEIDVTSKPIEEAGEFLIQISVKDSGNRSLNHGRNRTLRSTG